ncbi:hypothetical protein BFP97_20010 [Roseivirga sp. 4D4]|uniref:DUF4296 domain-containing protein n=1 Tax=Roseivirga sp. 4D4 TaxID=1889784 RepID=UPI000852A697|nr:DUF4296 domain-containing protein [Roseivirga sp. 4D4]OEK03662.1 hypothetical protein BFP97_20010 [Roseivirga sp. 4D4]
MKKVFLFTVALMVFSCGDKEQIPDNILSEAQMVDLMIDIRIAEGKVSTITLSNDSSAALYKVLEEQVFEDHNIDSTEYITSYNYYLLNPAKFLRITDIVIDSLKVRQQELTTGRRPAN